MSNDGWIGVDLDGTLAEYDQYKGTDSIGKPIPAMLARVKEWLADGREVRIVTARAGDPRQVPYINVWLEKHVGQVLTVTDRKDFDMEVLWDDRAITVERNTGKIIRASWTDVKPKNSKCEYGIPWVGSCKAKTNVKVDGVYVCGEHIKEKCGCGRQANRGCSNAGSFVCGAPLCADCRCSR